MKTKTPKGKKSNTAIPLASETVKADSVETIQTESPASEFPTDKTAERIPIKIVDGKFSFDGMRPATLEKAKLALRGSLEDETFRQIAGIEKVPNLPIDSMGVTPEAVGMALDASANIEVMILSARYAVPAEAINSMVAWTSEEHELLDKPIATQINKYFPGAWLKHTELFVVCATLLSCLTAKARMVEAYAKTELEKIGRAKPIQATHTLQTEKPVSAPVNDPPNNPRSLG